MNRAILKTGAWAIIAGLALFLMGVGYCVLTTPTETSPALIHSSVEHHTSQSSPRP